MLLVAFAATFPPTADPVWCVSLTWLVLCRTLVARLCVLPRWLRAAHQFHIANAKLSDKHGTMPVVLLCVSLYHCHKGSPFAHRLSRAWHSAVCSAAVYILHLSEGTPFAHGASLASARRDAVHSAADCTVSLLFAGSLELPDVCATRVRLTAD